MQTAYLFNYSGKPWLTQKYTRDILNVFYGSTPYSGWEGDEDEGHMSSWYVKHGVLIRSNQTIKHTMNDSPPRNH